MPKIADAGDMEVHQIAGSNFTFQGARLTNLGATEYTVVGVAVDATGSTAPYAADLREMLVAAVDSCKRSPRSDNLVVRSILFSTNFGRDGVNELHGFKLLSEVNPQADYPQPRPQGMTPLFDAAYSAVGAVVDYGDELMKNDYLANGIVFVITDGMDNYSTATPRMIREKIESVRRDEKLESMVTILVGLVDEDREDSDEWRRHCREVREALQRFKDEAGFDQYIDVGEVTSGKFSKLADFVSQSVSSQSQAIGTGGPSQNISATI